jgi:hypothetical protein
MKTSDVHTTNSKYWFFNHKKNLAFSYNFLLFIKKILEKLFKIKILKSTNKINHYETSSYPISLSIIHDRNFLLIKEINNFLRLLKFRPNNKKINKLITQHDNIFYKKNPIKNNSGGIGYNNSLFLYIFTNFINVDLIIESGVWQGYTTYIFDQNLKNKKKICFDINFSKLIYKSKKAEYCNYDIESHKFNKKYNLKNSLAFFDDHVSQVDRFLFSHKLKIPYMVFDDDVSFLTAHSDGWPSIPTISILKSKNKILNFKWKSLDKIGLARLNSKIYTKVINKYLYVQTPYIGRITGYHLQPPMSFLIKKK